MQYVPLFKLPLENNKHPNFEWRGGVWILMFFKVNLFEYNVSRILSAIVGYDIRVTELFSILRN